MVYDVLVCACRYPASAALLVLVITVDFITNYFVTN